MPIILRLLGFGGERKQVSHVTVSGGWREKWKGVTCNSFCGIVHTNDDDDDDDDEKKHRWMHQRGGICTYNDDDDDHDDDDDDDDEK